MAPLNDRDPLIIVIPARYGSSRLPGKPLADLCGRPLVVRVLEAASRAEPDRLVVATDDQRIAAAVTGAGFETILTGEAATGTARVAMAWRKMGSPEGRIVNLQGDEPFVRNSWIDALLSVDPRPDRVVTLARREPPSAAQVPDSVKVLLDSEGSALEFARRLKPDGDGVLVHLGLYCFSPESLRSCAAAPPTDKSISTGLEQLAWMAEGIDITVVKGRFRGIGVDTPLDLEMARQMYADQREGIE